MAVYLDDEAVELSGGDLAAVLTAARDRLAGSGRLVVEVQVDGEAVAADAWQGATVRSLSGSDLRLYTADPRDLSRSTLESLLAALDEVAKWQREAAELLQQDQQPQAMGKLTQAMEVWQQSQQAVTQATTLTGIDLNDTAVDGEPASAIIDQVLAQLRAVRDAIQSGDMVGLADSLAYEWPGTTEKWQKLVTSVIEKIDRL